jgi:structural maintenance of chromosome 4
VVARTAFRNNSSKYSINDKTSTFTEVTTLLKTRGIDLDHKRFLILQVSPGPQHPSREMLICFIPQGEVESIAQMKPKAQTEHEDGLLEYLEDIIGTSMYKQPIEEAQVEVDNFNEARAEKITRLSIVAKEKSSLESRKREAETYLRAMNELTRKKSLLCQFHMSTLHSNIDITETAMVTLKERLSSEESKNKSTLEEIDELQKAYDEKLEAFEQVKHHVDELAKQAKQIEKEQVSLAEKKKHQATKQKKLKKSIHDVSTIFIAG